MSLFGGTIGKLEHSLNYASLKNRTISNNIANVDTPDYKAQSVSFRNILASESEQLFKTKQTHPKHIDFSSAKESGFRVLQSNATSYNHNGNNVDIDKEMAELAKNQIYYESLVDRINGKFRSLENVIKGGR